MMVPRQGTYKATPKKEKNLRMRSLPLKDSLKKKLMTESTITAQLVTNPSRNFEKDMPEKPIFYEFPDQKSAVFKNRKIDFSRKEVTPKPNIVNYE
jgi:hypothetical protein